MENSLENLINIFRKLTCNFWKNLFPKSKFLLYKAEKITIFLKDWIRFDPYFLFYFPYFAVL